MITDQQNNRVARSETYSTTPRRKFTQVLVFSFGLGLGGLGLGGLGLGLGLGPGLGAWLAYSSLVPATSLVGLSGPLAPQPKKIWPLSGGLGYLAIWLQPTAGIKNSESECRGR